MKMPILIRRIEGISMVPSLKPGQLVMAWKYSEPQVGDLVILWHEDLEKIKRIHRINGRQYYVLGDNRAVSIDSRHFGYLDRSRIIARVIWPIRFLFRQPELPF